MKAFWQGSDTLYLVKYPPSRKIKYVYMFCFRIFARLVDYFVQEHVCAHKALVKNLEKFGVKKKISVRPDTVFYPEKIEKKPHTEFNILYYMPRTKNPPYTKWVYGYDIYVILRDMLDNVNWIIVDGTKDMKDIFPITDFYLRCNRHDGHPRLIDECEINNIPYYWSQTEPDLDEIVDKLIEEITKWAI